MQRVRQQAALIVDNKYLVAFLGGGAGSVIAQLFSVPIDIISQHLMLVGQQNPHTQKVHTTKRNLNIERILVPDSLQKASTFRIVKYLSREIYLQEKLKGFYRGYYQHFQQPLIQHYGGLFIIFIKVN